jgi:hypothetical protein
MRCLATLTVVVGLLGAGDDPGKPPYNPNLDLPQGWRTEDSAYPPRWAQQLPWKGDLQIRFPPGWFQPDSPFFWSYPVLYRLEGDVLSGRDDLEKALRAYDLGLYRGGLDPAKYKVAMGEDREASKLGHAVVRRSVTIDGFDPFQTKKELTTHLEVFRWYCPKADRTEVLILRSPRPLKDDDEVWKSLLPFWEKLTCHDPAGTVEAR